MERKALESYLNTYLEIENFQDYGPNGLQIEGKEEIKKVAFAVSATQQSISQAIAAKADTLIVHHGLFWVFHGHRPIIGPFAKRVRPLIQHEINLFGYHLPLDAHLEVGNAAIIAKKIGAQNIAPFGDYKGAPLGVSAVFPGPKQAGALKQELEKLLDHQVIHAAADNDKIETIGIITGGANSGWSQAWKDDLDSYLTGEISEHDWHESREAGVHMFAGGHNATESLGIQALMQHLQEKFDIECVYFPSDNPA